MLCIGWYNKGLTIALKISTDRAEGQGQGGGKCECNLINIKGVVCSFMQLQPFTRNFQNGGCFREEGCICIAVTTFYPQIQIEGCFRVEGCKCD